MMDDVIRKLIYEAQSSEDVRNLLQENGLLDRSLWQPIGGDYGNETLIRHQSPSAELALGERCINSIDSILMKKCVERGINPRGTNAPKTMRDAAEKFCGVPEGKLDKYTKDMYNISEIFCTATGKIDERLTINLVDFGEGQTPDYMKHSFLSLPIGKSSPYKQGIPFVQGRYNQGSGGSYKFSDYTLIVTRRAPTLLTKNSRDIIDPHYNQKDVGIDEIYRRKDEWGWTIVTKFARKTNEEITWYGYLAPDGKIPSFKENEILLIPPRQIPTIPGNLSKKAEAEFLKNLRNRGSQLAYSQSATSGTLVKLFDFQLKSALRADIWSEGARDMRANVFYENVLPIRMTELREWGLRIKGRGDARYLTGLLNNILQADKGKNKLVRKGWPKSPENVHINKLGGNILVTKYILDTMRKYTDQSENWLAGNSVIYVLNGQVHYKETTGYLGKLKLYNLEGNLLVIVDINHLPIDIRDKIFRVDRANIERSPEWDALRETVEKLIIDDDDIKKANDEKFYEKTRDVEIDKKYSEKIIQKLMKDNPNLIELLKGTELPMPVGSVKLVKVKGEEYRNKKFGKKSPTIFQLMRN